MRNPFPVATAGEGYALGHGAGRDSVGSTCASRTKRHAGRRRIRQASRGNRALGYDQGQQALRDRPGDRRTVDDERKAVSSQEAADRDQMAGLATERIYGKLEMS